MFDVYDRIFKPQKFFELIDNKLVTPVSEVKDRIGEFLSPLVQPCLECLEKCFRKCFCIGDTPKWVQEMSGRDMRELAKSLKGIDLNKDKMIDREEMFELVAKVYTSGILTEQEDLKKSAAEIVKSKFYLSLLVQKTSARSLATSQLRIASAATRSRTD